MTEQTNESMLQDNDFKYVMQDAGSVYLGARFSFSELLEAEMVPFKLKAIISHYVLKEAQPETTLESQFYYLEKGTFLYQVFDQLKIKIKVNVLEEKTTLFGKKKSKYVEKKLNLKELTDMNLARKKMTGIIIREIIVSKLAMMGFSV